MSNRVVVIGAGLAGLMAANEIVRADVEVVVLDKGRGVGGRMATRRVTAPDGRTAVFDHGAQFFTTRSDEFRNLVDGWVSAGLVREWCRGFSGDDSHPRYVAIGGMASLTKHLARGLDVRTSTLVFSVTPGQSRRWTVTIDDGSTIETDAVVSTCPLLQSYSILASAGVELPPELMFTEYDRTIGLLAVLDRGSAVPAPGGLQNPDDVFSWIGDNVARGVSEVPAVTFHANPQWSLAGWDESIDELDRRLRSAASPWLGAATIVATEVKKWRFATPRSIWPDSCLVTADGRLALAGDAFAGPKVEGAVSSGVSAGRAIVAGLLG